MDILYEFDTIGIIYTAVVGGLFLLLFLPAILFAKRRKQTNPGTVFYRVLDIVLIVALAVLWFTYVLCHVEMFGLAVKPDGDALAFFNGNTVLFSIPYVGSLHGVFASVLGTVLLGLLSLMAILSLIFSFAFRRKKRAEDEQTTAENADDNVDAADCETVVEAVVFEPVGIEPNDGQAGVMTPAFAEATEAAEDEIVPEKEDDLVAVEVLEESAEYVPEEFVPVEVLSEEPAREEILTAEIQEDVPQKELSPEVKDAIRTVVLGTPQTVKDALKVVIEEDPFIVREVLRVIVETPSMETPTEAPAAESTESAETSEETPDDSTSAMPLPEFPFIAEEDVAPIGEPAREADQAPTEESAPPASETAVSAIAATTDEIDPEPVAVVSLFAHVSNKTYSSSLRRPDTKKKSVAKDQA